MVDPLPSWPAELSPQQRTVPSAITAHVCTPPTGTVLPSRPPDELDSRSPLPLGPVSPDLAAAATTGTMATSNPAAMMMMTAETYDGRFVFMTLSADGDTGLSSAPGSIAESTR